jgi:hypothetical protein
MLILEYNPNNPDIMGIIREHWTDLQASPTFGNIFINLPRLVHTRGKNLSDSLVKANTTYPKADPPSKTQGGSKTPTITICRNQFKCKSCPKKSNQKGIKSIITKQTYILPSKDLYCTTRNLIYALECNVCHKQYVGETKRSFKERIAEHLGDIKNKRLNKPLGKHFSLPGHQTGSILTFILETLKGDPDHPLSVIKRRTRERFWIYRLRTPEPLGLNTMLC